MVHTFRQNLPVLHLNSQTLPSLLHLHFSLKIFMASLAFTALSLSPKPIALLPTRYKSQNYAFAVQGPPLSSNARFRLNAVPRSYEVLGSKGRGFKTLWCASASKDGNAELKSSAEQQHIQATKDGEAELKSSAEQQHKEVVKVVMAFYEAINRRDLKALSDIMSDKCLFHDLAYPQGFEGKAAILQYIKDLIEALGRDMQFKIDGLSGGDDLTVAVLWHLEWQGRPLPLSKGCGMFYCEKEGDKILIRMVYDFVESPLKPGELILRLLKTITSLFEQFPLIAKSII